MKYLAGVLLALLSFQSHALLVSPSDCNTTFTCITSTSTSAFDASDVASLFGVADNLDLYFKIDIDSGGETGLFAGSYTASSILPSGDESGLSINYDSGPVISCPDCYLVVKDGNHSPSQYLFDISEWGGLDVLSLSGFWEGVGGSISHVAIFGVDDPSTRISHLPVPASVWLFGTALMGFVGFSRRRIV
jgi:hypothetical protein